MTNRLNDPHRHSQAGPRHRERSRPLSGLSDRSRRRAVTGAVAALSMLAVAAPATATAFVSPNDSSPQAQTASSAESSKASPRADTFVDEFDGAAGSAPDPAKWTHEVNGDGGGNNELQYYTDRTENASLDGEGHLVITARKENPANYQCWYGPCEYTSARLNTASTFSQAYGHIEARIQVTRGQGMWPAFWMLGNDIGSVGWPDCGEIDVLENIGREPSTVHGTLHGPGYSGGDAIGAAYDLPGGEVFADDFHTFAVDWEPEKITWSVDGNAYQTRTPADLGGDRWVFDHEFFLIMNVAVGGNWPGPPDDSTQFPQEMKVDYVRVSTADSAGELAGRVG